MARRGRKLMVEWAAADDAASLYERYRRERRPDVRPRLHGLWLVRTGRTTREASEVLGVDERTVQRWLAWYRTGGLAPLKDRHAGSQGAPSFLTPEQKADLAAEVATGRFRTAAEIRAWVQERWGASYTEGGMYALLRRLCRAPSMRRPTTSRRRGGKRGARHRPRRGRPDRNESDRLRGRAAPRPTRHDAARLGAARHQGPAAPPAHVRVALSVRGRRRADRARLVELGAVHEGRGALADGRRHPGVGPSRRARLGQRPQPPRRRHHRPRPGTRWPATLQPGAEPGRAALRGDPPPRRRPGLRHPRRQGRRCPGLPGGARRRSASRPPPLRLGLDQRRHHLIAHVARKCGVARRGWYKSGRRAWSPRRWDR